MSGRILSIDYGTSRVGFAISDPLYIIATPLKTIKNKSIQDLLKHIELIVREYDIKAIVVGLPLGLNGKETKQTKTVKTKQTKRKNLINKNKKHTIKHTIQHNKKHIKKKPIKT